MVGKRKPSNTVVLFRDDDKYIAQFLVLRDDYVDLTKFSLWQELSSKLNAKKHKLVSPEVLQARWVNTLDSRLEETFSVQLPPSECDPERSLKENLKASTKRVNIARRLIDRKVATSDLSTEAINDADAEKRKLVPSYYKLNLQSKLPKRFKGEMEGTKSIDVTGHCLPKQVFLDKMFYFIHRSNDYVDLVRCEGLEYLVKLYGGWRLEDKSLITETTICIAGTDEDVNTLFSKIHNCILYTRSFVEEHVKKESQVSALTMKDYVWTAFREEDCMMNSKVNEKSQCQSNVGQVSPKMEFECSEELKPEQLEAGKIPKLGKMATMASGGPERCGTMDDGESVLNIAEFFDPKSDINKNPLSKVAAQQTKQWDHESLGCDELVMGNVESAQGSLSPS